MGPPLPSRNPQKKKGVKKSIGTTEGGKSNIEKKKRQQMALRGSGQLSRKETDANIEGVPKGAKP